jgi:hypothetical protein
MSDTQKVITGVVRLSYPHLFEPKKPAQPDDKVKYSATVLLPKTDTETKTAIDAAIDAAKQKGAKDKWGGMPKLVPTPVHDGDGARPSDGEDFGPECKGCWVFTASNADKPGIIDRDKTPITVPNEIYGGVYARVSVRFYPYMYGGKKGVGCILLNVMKIKDGEPLSGHSDPLADFAGIEAVDDEDEVPFF